MSLLCNITGVTRYTLTRLKVKFDTLQAVNQWQNKFRRVSLFGNSSDAELAYR